jgi:hypothetical protein
MMFETGAFAGSGCSLLDGLDDSRYFGEIGGTGKDGRLDSVAPDVEVEGVDRREKDMTVRPMDTLLDFVAGL